MPHALGFQMGDIFELLSFPKLGLFVITVIGPTTSSRSELYHLIPSIPHAPLTLLLPRIHRLIVQNNKTMAMWKQIVCLVASISAVGAFMPGQTRYAAGDLVRGTNVEASVTTWGLGVWVCLHV